MKPGNRLPQAVAVLIPAEFVLADKSETQILPLCVGQRGFCLQYRGEEIDRNTKSHQDLHRW